MKSKQNEMEVQQGKMLASAFGRTEAYLDKSSVERSSQSQMVHDLAIAVAARKEAEAREKSAEMFAAATVAAAQKAETNANEQLRLLTYASKTRFNKEICEWHSINMKLIDQLLQKTVSQGNVHRNY